MGVPAPLPATAPVELFSHIDTVGVAADSDPSPVFAKGMFSCGYGYARLGDMGGEGGARGECHDWVLWNESDDSAGELGSGSFSGVSCGRSKAGVEVRTLSEGAVAARLDAKAATLVRLKRICPAPSIEPASSESEPFESLRFVLSATGPESWSALPSDDAVLAVSAMFPTWPFEAVGAIGPTE